MATTAAPQTTIHVDREADVYLYFDFAYQDGLDLEAGEEITGGVEVEIGRQEGGGWVDVTSEFMSAAPAAIANPDSDFPDALSMVRWRKKQAAADDEQARIRGSYAVRAACTKTGGERITLLGRLVIHDAPRL